MPTDANLCHPGLNPGPMQFFCVDPQMMSWFIFPMVLAHFSKCSPQDFMLCNFFFNNKLLNLSRKAYDKRLPAYNLFDLMIDGDKLH